ncbi:MAG: tetratricopeptide repeat protein, partial [Planctomycetota bacterium]
MSCSAAPRHRRSFALVLLVLTVVCPNVATHGQGTPLVPETFKLAEAARRAIESEWLTEEERSDLRVFHGVWDDRDLSSPTRRAAVALNAWDFEEPAFDDATVPVEIRAEAMLLRGELQSAVAMLEDVESLRAARIRAQALESLGRSDAANEAVDAPVRTMLDEKVEDAATLTDGVRAMLVRSRIEGQPAKDFQSMMNLLGRAHQELDRLYWPAKLSEAQLLLDKDNEEEAIVALFETLRLNPRCAEAWYALGRVALGRFDFNSAASAAEALERQNPDHPLAAMLLAESRLIQDDPDGAMELLAPLVQRLPGLRDAHAFVAAAEALRYDDEALREALERHEQLSPGSGRAYAVVGRHLSLARQYEASAEMLEEAIRRQPAWPEPRIELGLMELQSGREMRALDALKEVAVLDPFNKRAANSLFLLEEMAGYERLESEHFIVRYKPGIDVVMAEMMPARLEAIHRIVATRFDFEPDRKTIIELMPDHPRFAVRITGMPWIHTVAACTGPVIALEVPREGKRSEHLGLFDWPRVLQHEYTHTITLAQTRNRIPHWLTEAAAVSMEQAPRTYDRCLLLATAYQNDELFDLDEIKWAFVRPKRPSDRAQAYAQGHWMVQFMNERFGSSALVRLLGRYFEGQREQEAIPAALGISREQFFADFREWADEEVKSWGLAAEPSMLDLTDEHRWADPDLTVAMLASQQARLDAIVEVLTRQIGSPKTRRARPLQSTEWPDLVRPRVQVTDDMLAEWLERFPDHPDLLELFIRRSLEREEGVTKELIPVLERYATARP